MNLIISALASCLVLTSALNVKRDLTPASNLPGTWKYQGCYRDDTSYRTFDGPVLKNDNMTGQVCVNFCDSKGYTFAGTEFGRECYCGYGYGFSGSPDSNCTKPCAGDSTQVCGGSARLTVYANGQPIPIENQGLNVWLSQGCFFDSVSNRTLANLVSSSTTQTVSKCLSVCQSRGYHYAGVEFGKECWCGHSIDNSPAHSYPDNVPGRCDIACSGNSSEVCGGDARIIVYHLPTTPLTGWKDIGCYVDNTQGRILGVTVPTTGGFQNMTIENCLTACQAAGYSLAGLEYGRECYCDTFVKNGGSPAPYPPNRLQGQPYCEMACNGNKEEVCGGPDRLNAYTYTLPITKTTSASIPTSTPTPSYILGNTGYFNDYDPAKPDVDPYWQFESASDAPPGHLKMKMIEGPRLLHDTGNRCISINDTDYSDTGIRGYCFAQDIIMQPGNWQLTLYPGRILHANGSIEGLQWSFWLNGNVYTQRNDVCGGPGKACQYVNGLAGMSREMFYFTTYGENGGHVRFKICGYYLDGATRDVMLFDDVTLYGPTQS